MTGEQPQFQRPARSSKPRKSGVVIPNAPRWHQWLAASFVWLVMNLVSITVRYRFQDPHGFFQRKDSKPAIYCFWHNRLSLCVKLYFKYGRTRYASPGVAGLVSASKDGALLSAIFACFGVQPVRGSSSRRGAQALMELTTWAQRGYDLAITPDGPRGPKYVLAEGAITLAQITGLPLVAASYHLSRKVSLNSWDQFQIPLPFSRCDVVIGKVFQVPRELSDAEREKFRAGVEAELRAITRD